MTSTDAPLGRTPGALPNLVIIGAQKCGTSALHEYLDLHPQAQMSRPKELNFFIAERAWDQGIDWYRGHFDGSVPVRGESSPNYTAAPNFGGVPERMASVIPDAKLVYLVRDPVARIASHLVHSRAAGRDARTPEAALRVPTTTYVSRSLYMTQLDPFLAHFPVEQVLVLDQLDLLDRRDETLARVFGWLGIDDTFRHESFAKLRHVTAQKRGPLRATRTAEARTLAPRVAAVLPGRLARRLQRRPAPTPPAPPPPPEAVSPVEVLEALSPESLERLRADAQRFRAFTGLPFDSWSV